MCGCIGAMIWGDGEYPKYSITIWGDGGYSNYTFTYYRTRVQMKYII